MISPFIFILFFRQLPTNLIHDTNSYNVLSISCNGQIVICERIYEKTAYIFIHRLWHWIRLVAFLKIHRKRIPISFFHVLRLLVMRILYGLSIFSVKRVRLLYPTVKCEHMARQRQRRAARICMCRWQNKPKWKYFKKHRARLLVLAALRETVRQKPRGFYPLHMSVMFSNRRIENLWKAIFLYLMDRIGFRIRIYVEMKFMHSVALSYVLTAG